MYRPKRRRYALLTANGLQKTVPEKNDGRIDDRTAVNLNERELVNNRTFHKPWHA